MCCDDKDASSLKEPDSQPEKRSVLIQFFLTPTMARQLEEIADANRRSRQQQAAWIIEETIKSKGGNHG